MKGFTHAAIAAAMVMAAGLLPSSGAHGQSRASVFSRFDIDSGSRIGVTVQDVEDADSKDAQRPKAGVVIETVDPGGPADKAGIKAGDTLTDFDGEHVRSVRQFSRQCRLHVSFPSRLGSTVPLDIRATLVPTPAEVGTSPRTGTLGST